MDPHHGHSTLRREGKSEQSDERRNPRTPCFLTAPACGFPNFRLFEFNKTGPIPPHVGALCQKIRSRSIEKTDGWIRILRRPVRPDYWKLSKYVPWENLPAGAVRARRQ